MAKTNKTIRNSERTRNKDGTYRWRRDGEEGEHVINLFRMHSLGQRGGADPTNLSTAYIRQIYYGNDYFSGPISGANHRFHLKAFREAYKRLAREYVAEGEARDHQGMMSILFLLFLLKSSLHTYTYIF